MGLFVDGPATTILDMTDQDSGLLDVAGVNGINATTKIRLAHDEIATDLRLWLNKPKLAAFVPWAPALHLDQIVWTPELKRWETLYALTLFYRDAYFSELVDRYQEKWQAFSNNARDARENYIARGMSIVRDPLTLAAPPILGTTPGPQAGGTFYASVAWVNAAGQNGEPSLASVLTLSDGNLMTVTAPAAPPNAVGFNVYAGSSPTALLLQNTVALPLGTTFIYVPGTGVNSEPAGSGQTGDFVRPLARLLLRG
jgi:hypothetical protein